VSNTVIQVDHLSKQYRLGVIGGKRLVDDVNRWWAKLRGKPDPLSRIGQQPTRNSVDQNGNAGDEVWALNDVSFDVKQGEVLGIIGRNGAGKSTLLKILSRVTAPTSGEVLVKGRIASLLEVGTGFHPELTGRENIFLNGAILGMTKPEIKKKFDEIVDFSEVEKFIDTPVKRYSSGMYVRLAFAVAAHLDPEILVVDEVLAVGDAAFQKKCMGKMGEVAKGGRTVLFVSHNMGVVSALTQRCLYLESGQLAALGDSRKMVELYLKRSLQVQADQGNDLAFYRRDRNPDSPVRIVGIGLNGSQLDSSVLPDIELGATFTVSVQLNVIKPLHGAFVDVLLKTSHGERVTILLSWDQGYALSLKPGQHEVSARVEGLPLAPGEYFVDVGINQSTRTKAHDVILDFPLFRVVNRGQITHWLERRWGALHCNSVHWDGRLLSRLN
jgi:lipopolysaccharide transport system ATP-binding protein